MRDVTLIRNLLLEKKEYTTEQMMQKLGVEDSTSFCKLLIKFIDDTLYKIRPTDGINNFKYLFKIFKYISMEQINDNADYLYSSLKKINSRCFHTLKKSHGSESFNYYSLLNKIMDNVDVTLININYARENASSTATDEELSYNMIKYLIYDVKNYNYLFEIIKNFPDNISVKSGDGKYLVDELIDDYIKVIVSDECHFDIIYFEKVIKLFALNRSFNNSSNYEKKLVNKLYLTIDNLKRMNLKKREVKKVVFFLNELIGDIKKKDINEHDLDCINYKYNINPLFSEDALEEFKNTVKLDDKLFLDCTKKFTITIDTDGANVFDDAISLEKQKDGTWLLGVYVADAARFVPENSVLDIVAFKRSETVYLPQNSLTMLPQELSKVISLDAKRNNCAIGYFFVLNSNMEIEDFRVRRCVINVDRNYSYTGLKNLLDTSYNLDELQTIKQMIAVTEKLRSNNDVKENYTLLKKIKKDYTRCGTIVNTDTYGSEIIKEFMILTNHHIAMFFCQHPEIPFIYRNNWSDYSTEIVANIKKITMNGVGCNEVINYINGMYIPSTYSVDNLGHNGLNLKSYCHATNPIRNYVSLIVERAVIKNMIYSTPLDTDWQTERKRYDEVANYVNERVELNKDYQQEYIKILQKR